MLVIFMEKWYGWLSIPTISTSDLASSHAVEAMNEILSHSNEPITLVTLGPLTNIALLFNTYPECKTMLKKLL